MRKTAGAWQHFVAFKRTQELILTHRGLILSRNLLSFWKHGASCKYFDIFFGFEAATSERLKDLNKGCGVDVVSEALKVARRFGFGVTGNFIIDPDFEESISTHSGPFWKSISCIVLVLPFSLRFPAQNILIK